MGGSPGRDDNRLTDGHAIVWSPSDSIAGLTPVPREGQGLTLPEVGSIYRNPRGMEFLVLKHTTINSSGKRIEPSHKSGWSLERLVTTPIKTDLPVVAARGFSQRLLKLWAEFEAVCPKPTVIVDTAFASPIAQMHFGGHSINWLADPHAAVLTVHSSETEEDTLAHELMHGWLDLVRGYEDQRAYRDPTDHPANFLVDSTQCMVLDCMVQEAIGARGFDSCHWSRDYVEFMYENAVGLWHGVYPVSRYEASFAARLYALPEAVPHLFRLSSDQVSKFIFARNVFRDRLPDLARLGDDIVRAFREGDYHTGDAAHRLIDRCLSVVAQYVGMELDLGRDLVLWRPPQPEYLDKFPQMLPGFPVQLKYEINRRLLRESWPTGTLIQAAVARRDTVQVTFTPPDNSPSSPAAITWEWQSPYPLALSVRTPRLPDPQDLLPRARPRPRSWELLQPGSPAMGPLSARVRAPGAPGMPGPEEGNPNMRHYLPGLARFISRVHLHQAVALGKITYEELREHWGINIALGTPEVFPLHGGSEHPYTYAANAPLNLMDPAGASPQQPETSGASSKEPDWVKMTQKCMQQCAFSRTSKEFAECFLKCMSKGFSKETCVKLGRYLPRQIYVCPAYGNPCDPKITYHNPRGQCEDCCYLKGICCRLFAIGGLALKKCNDQETLCDAECCADDTVSVGPLP